MTTGTARTVKVHYRLAQLAGPDSTGQTLQQRIHAVMSGPLGLDARERVFHISDDGQHRGCLNFSEDGTAFLADIMHLDGRSALPTWLHPKEPRPVAEVIPRTLAEGEASLGEPVYLMVRGNHVAAIERMAFRTISLARYINALLKAGSQLDPGSEWKLQPKIQIEGGASLGGSAKKLVFKARGLAVGEGPTDGPGGFPLAAERPKSRKFDEMAAEGWRVLDMMRAAGADETKLEALRANMSPELALKARLEVSIASVRRKTTADVHPDALQQAVAELTNQGDVHILSSDGKTDGKLVQLMHSAEVLETGGLIDWQRATYALVSAMNAWAAKGSIDLD
ncbi:hypothetical protein [Phenylobacterium sp.]|uniref:hypothetical protein n=1 Tax=Phenylobacterium sp. TaxID=1871053 RepID=UPI002737700E|nr:hypothetical protein [Phenylobacterium sp.]MDP3853134.1 hypothetical protein [Phenylobacterium sp.]